MADDPILIAGGGIAGLAAALGLAKVGRECLVLERAPAFEETGAGIQLGPNAVRALIWLGAWDALKDKAFAPRRILVRDGVSGRTLQNIALDHEFAQRFGEPYRVAHRADLQRALLAAASALPRITLKTGSEVLACAADSRSVRVECAAGHGYRAPALIGADGLHSRIRDSVMPDRRSPRPRAHALYRALIPVFTGLSDDAAESVCLWLCPGGHVVHYPVSGGAMLNIVAACERPPPQAIGERAASDEVLSAFGRACDGLRVILALPNEWRSWPAADRAPRPGWSNGRMVLVGDAAHPALPYLAQGAAMALEDACALARVVGARSSASFPEFETLRFARTAHVQRASRRMRQVYHAGGLMRHARDAALRAVSPAGFLNRLAWIYGHDPMVG